MIIEGDYLQNSGYAQRNDAAEQVFCKTEVSKESNYGFQMVNIIPVMKSRRDLQVLPDD